MDKDKGVYQKFTVTRNDGKSEPGQKHHGCRYFVIDLDHDIHGISAILAYAESCKDTHPELSKDLNKLAPSLSRADQQERKKTLNKIDRRPTNV